MVSPSGKSVFTKLPEYPNKPQKIEMSSRQQSMTDSSLCANYCDRLIHCMSKNNCWPFSHPLGACVMLETGV